MSSSSSSFPKFSLSSARLIISYTANDVPACGTIFIADGNQPLNSARGPPFATVAFRTFIIVASPFRPAITAPDCSFTVALYNGKETVDARKPYKHPMNKVGRAPAVSTLVASRYFADKIS